MIAAVLWSALIILSGAHTCIMTAVGLYYISRVARHYAGGSLAEPSAHVTTVMGNYWLTEKQRIRRERWRRVGRTAVWLCIAAVVVYVFA